MLQGGLMLRALDDLERAIDRLVKKASRETSGGSVLKDDEIITGQVAGQSGQINEEAAELIRRAVKRLKSL